MKERLPSLLRGLRGGYLGNYVDAVVDDQKQWIDKGMKPGHVVSEDILAKLKKAKSDGVLMVCVLACVQALMVLHMFPS